MTMTTTAAAPQAANLNDLHERAELVVNDLLARNYSKTQIGHAFLQIVNRRSCAYCGNVANPDFPVPTYPCGHELHDICAAEGCPVCKAVEVDA